MSRLVRINARGEREHLGQDGWFVVDFPASSPDSHTGAVKRGAPPGGTLPGACTLPASSFPRVEWGGHGHVSNCAPHDVGKTVQVFWPRFSTFETAAIFGWHESHVANALARIRDKERAA